MPARARCKFIVESMQKFAGPNAVVVLRAMYGPDIPEDEAFTKATPSGSLNVTITNPEVIRMLEPGRKFYLDLTPAAE